MRTEQEIFQLILKIAEEDEKIRAVYLNGSRANPKVKKDSYQDYDIVYLVNALPPFVQDEKFPQKFGKTLIVQEPEPTCPEKEHIWLMLFEDGTRIDLKIVEKAFHQYGSDSLTVPLLDKEGLFHAIPQANDRDYWIKKPTEAEYQASCNNFWWCLNNVAKGLKRKQFPYALRMYMETSHKELEQMLDWRIASKYNFQMTTGMWGKNVQSDLSAEDDENYKKTYSAGNEEALWQAIAVACDFFHTLAVQLGQDLNFVYQQSEEDGIRAYLKMVKNEEI